MQTPEEISEAKKNKIQEYLDLIKSVKFDAFPEICFVFQTFNKGHLSLDVLSPFLSLGVSNVIFFADGCVDDTLEIASSVLTGFNHMVIKANDRHEVLNYRAARFIASEVFGCDYVVYLQDDDLYSENLKTWLNAAKDFMERNKSTALIGFHGGADTWGDCFPATDSIVNSEFRMWSEGGEKFYSLEGVYSCRELQTPLSEDGSSYDFCAIVNRAPEMTRLDFLNEIDGFPVNMAPYQYEHIIHCLEAWKRGWNVVHMPILGIRRNVGIGGMRLFNNVSVRSRPAHFKDNWNRVYEKFSEFWSSEELKVKIQSARKMVPSIRV